MTLTTKYWNLLPTRISFLTFCFLSIFFIGNLSAQTSSYTLHTIKEGETLSAIAKMNKTTVGDIMRMNGMNSKSRLTNGAIIKIPSPNTNETPKATESTPVVMDKNLGIPAKPTVSVPEKKVAVPTQPKVEQPTLAPTNSIKYTIVKGDNLYKLSKQFKLTEAQLMQMNDMKDDKVKLGQVLIVNLPQAQTPKTVAIDTIKTIKTTITEKVQSKALMPALTNSVKKDTSVVTKSIITKVTLPKVETTIKKDTIKSVMPKQIDTISNHVVKIDSVLVVKTDTTLLVKKEVTPTLPSIIKDTLAIIEKAKPIELIPEPKPINKNNKYVNDEGYFAAFFNRKAIADNPSSGDAGAFKTASGWEDKKYYILINGLLPGTIVRVTANNKSICAKVLTGLPEVKEDNGYLARLSNAAVSALGIETNKFAVTVNHE